LGVLVRTHAEDPALYRVWTRSDPADGDARFATDTSRLSDYFRDMMEFFG
jgi:hypothetical protein